MKNYSLLILFLIILNINAKAQDNKTDSLIKAMTNDETTPKNDPGVQLIQSGNYADANKFFSAEISKDESDRAAYFRRGVANWALSDTLSACRDWSAVLALGDTEMFNLLESKCHSTMIIDDDRIPAKQYKKLWAKTEPINAKTVVNEMPSYPGGNDKLFEYINKNLHKLADSRHGTVFVNFLISPKGKILYPYVTHGIGKPHNTEALRIIRSMPNWNPGKQKGKAVYVRSSIPIRF